MRSPSIHKVRRVELGGKRANGHELQRKYRRVRRPDPCCILAGDPDDSLTNCAGLASFGRFAKEIGLDRKLAQTFNPMKRGKQVVYSMGNQLRLLLDLIVADEERVFGLEALAADRLFCRLAGESVPSLDTVYRDLRRFEEASLGNLEALMIEQGLFGLQRSPKVIHVDVDSTVEPLFGHQEGALLGPNPRYRGRVSYHPLPPSVWLSCHLPARVGRPAAKDFESLRYVLPNAVAARSCDSGRTQTKGPNSTSPTTGNCYQKRSRANTMGEQRSKP